MQGRRQLVINPALLRILLARLCKLLLLSRRAQGALQHVALRFGDSWTESPPCVVQDSAAQESLTRVRNTPAEHVKTCLSVSNVLQEFYFYCPPGLRGERGKLGRRAGMGKRSMPEAECLTPASKRARLTHLATTKDASKGPPPPEDLVRVWQIS